MNEIIVNRLTSLRKKMEEAGIDYYLIPTADFHNSEYVNEYFKVREHFCGFTGSNGTLVVWADGAGLWTDGRYFIQAERELAGTGVTLFRMLDEGVPTITDFLKKNMEKGQCLAFDGRCVESGVGLKYEDALKDKDVKICFTEDVAGSLWEDRPALPAEETFVIPDALAGESVTQKLTRVRKEMEEKGANAFFLSKLDDLMWLFNIRGGDIECNPVAMSYAFITMDRAFLFLQDAALTGAVRLHLEKSGVTVEGYDGILGFLQKLPDGYKVLVDDKNCSYSMYKVLSDKQTIVKGSNPTEKMKACKNETELANMRRVYLEDSAAVCKFIYWVKKNIGKIEITEITAAEKMDSLRREIKDFIDLSFPTISAYGANAAMMHYDPTPENHAVLKPEGMLLVDSGGQYMGGTTDVTRTIVVGPISDEIKKHYTLAAAGMLALTNAKWIYGCTGRNLDILARKPLWNIGIDYQCGTGHGIGYILNVHEGPQGIRWRFTEGMTEAVLEEGMVVSNEPGVYIADSHGIRIENIMVARGGEKNMYGKFMYFETLTYAPIDLEAIDTSLLSLEEKAYLNEYHASVFEKISPFLDAEEKEWLKEATKAV